MKRVVLFDLDGTVLTYEGGAPGPGRTALDAAMRDLYALEEATKGLRVAGGTDRALARSLLARAGVHGVRGGGRGGGQHHRLGGSRSGRRLRRCCWQMCRLC